MSSEHNLPFSLGNTYFGGVNISASQGRNLEGAEFRVRAGDNALTGSGLMTTFRVVRCAVTSTFAPTAGDGVAFRTPSFGTASQHAAALGDAGGVTDWHLSTSVKKNDLFLVAVEGYAKLKTNATGSARAAGTYVAWNADGRMHTVTTADSSQVCFLAENVKATWTNRLINVYVNPSHRTPVNA